MALSGKLSCLDLIPCGFQMGEVPPLPQVPVLPALGAARTKPPGQRGSPSRSGWPAAPPAARARRRTWPHPPSPVPACTCIHRKTSAAASARSPSPSGRPSRRPSPGSVFIINISLFRSLGLS